ncbi:EamA family transporter [Luedemannella helvata]|uniref:EamA family transporter n=1 Tax=Luedemannella helvata TaxID=349315 RepID=A0ABP4W1H0_9ACTN
MRPRHIALAVAVAAAWGFNFVVIDVGLREFPPLLFSALRFALAAFPAVLLVGPPRVPWRWVFAVGAALAVAKFSLLFLGMAAGMPAGLSSVVLQGQAIFTVLFAVLLLGERPGRRQLAGLGVATAGIAVVAARLGPDRPAAAFVLVLGAAVCWGVANIAMRRANPPDTLRFMVWVSATAPLPLLALSLLTEGPAADLAALRGIDWTGVGALGYIAGVSTLAGFGAWGALIRRYGASSVAPFSMFVPFFGMASAALLLGEPVHPTDVLGGLLVVGGVLAGAVRSRSLDPHAAEGTTLVVEGGNHGVHGGEGGPALRRDGADAAPLRRDRAAVAE